MVLSKHFRLVHAGDGMEMTKLLQRRSVLLSVILVAVATVRIALTWPVFNATTDEPTQIACGMEWLDKHTYSMEHDHPPLARVAAALGPYLLGARSQAKEGSKAGAEILVTGGRTTRNLTAARAGILPFFWIACAAVFLWAKRAGGPISAVLAVLLFTNLPPVLAHSGLATTDMAVTGFVGAAALSLLLWFERPGFRRVVLLGVTVGLAILSKFSAIPFLASATAAMALSAIVPNGMVAVRALRPRHLTSLFAGLAVAALVIWGGYRFSYGRVPETDLVSPAPELISGIRAVKIHEEAGHLAYLLGRYSENGFREYYPIALGVKTPLAFLILLAVGTASCFRRWKTDAYRLPLAFSLGILLCAILLNRINIGVRHILPVYVGFSVVAAAGLHWLLAGKRAVYAGAALLLWLLVSVAASHPDYLPYFNEFVGSEPERVLIDSDLDWGQDMTRLAVRLGELKVSHFTYLPIIYLELSGKPLPGVEPMDIVSMKAGWHAAHVTQLKLNQYEIRQKNPDAIFWTDRVAPTERVGRGILLWHVPNSQ